MDAFSSNYGTSLDPCLFCLNVCSRDWHGIMDRDNQQAGEAEGGKICDPPGKIHRRHSVAYSVRN